MKMLQYYIVNVQSYNRGCGVLFILHQTLLRPIFFFQGGRAGLVWTCATCGSQTHDPIKCCLFQNRKWTGHLEDWILFCQKWNWTEGSLKGECLYLFRGKRDRNHTYASPSWYQTAPQVKSSTFLYPDFFNSCCSYSYLSPEHLIRICIRVKSNLISFSHFTYLTETLLITAKQGRSRCFKPPLTLMPGGDPGSSQQRERGQIRTFHRKSWADTLLKSK